MLDNAINKYIEKLSTKQPFSFNESFDFSRFCATNINKNEKSVRDLVIRVLDNIDNMPETTHCIWMDLVEALGLYPYLRTEQLTNSERLRMEFHRSSNIENVYFHSKQLEQLLKLENDESIILSAPTSFGKSLLIEEMIASYKYDNIVIIQPTLALLDETRKKLTKYRETYNIVVSTGQAPKSKNIFLFTGERVCEYREFPQIDFFVIDEFYKLSLHREENERATALNLSLYKLLKYTKKFMLLGPHITDISSEFIEYTSANWVYTDYSTVAIDVKNLHQSKLKKKEKAEALFRLLNDLIEPTIIYCSSPDRANKLSTDYANGLNDENIQFDGGTDNHNLSEWISENIHEDWFLVSILKKGIGVHHGGLPRHVGSAIVDAFNNGQIKYLFCTSTLIEGVNTSAKNVVFFDRKKGTGNIDYFDYKNIAGRSGRMMQHFTGNVYQFEPQPKASEEHIDIPIIDQTDSAPIEMLVQIDDIDLKPKSQVRLENLKEYPQKLQEIIKENVGFSIIGQIDLFNQINKNFNINYELLAWRQIPTYEQLDFVLSICWDHFMKNNESKGGVFSSKQLAFYTSQYCQKKSLKGMIYSILEKDKYGNADDYTHIQDTINKVLQISKHWFDYKLPKWLSVFASIQEYVCELNQKRPGNYTYFIQMIENQFLPKELKILLEYDIPSSTIKKMEPHLRGCESIDDIILHLRKVGIRELDLLEYEKKCLLALL